MREQRRLRVGATPFRGRDVACSDHEALLRARGRDVEQTHALGGVHQRALGREHRQPRLGPAEQHEADVAAAPLDAARAPVVAPRAAIRGEQIDVLPVEPLRAVDAEHVHRLVRRRARTAFLVLARQRAGTAQERDHRGRRAGGLLERLHQIAEEAIEVRDAVAAEVAPGLAGLERHAFAQALDEALRRLALERNAQLVERLEEGDGRLRPERDALDLRHVRRHRGCRGAHRRARVFEPLRVGAVDPARTLGQQRVPERKPGGVGHPRDRRAQRRHQREQIERVEHATHQRDGVLDLATLVELGLALHHVGARRARAARPARARSRPSPAAGSRRGRAGRRAPRDPRRRPPRRAPRAPRAARAGRRSRAHRWRRRGAPAASARRRRALPPCSRRGPRSRRTSRAARRPAGCPASPPSPGPRRARLRRGSRAPSGSSRPAAPRDPRRRAASGSSRRRADRRCASRRSTASDRRRGTASAPALRPRRARAPRGSRTGVRPCPGTRPPATDRALRARARAPRDRAADRARRAAGRRTSRHRAGAGAHARRPAARAARCAPPPTRADRARAR